MSLLFFTLQLHPLTSGCYSDSLELRCLHFSAIRASGPFFAQSPRRIEKVYAVAYVWQMGSFVRVSLSRSWWRERRGALTSREQQKWDEMVCGFSWWWVSGGKGIRSDWTEALRLWQLEFKGQILENWGLMTSTGEKMASGPQSVQLWQMRRGPLGTTFTHSCHVTLGTWAHWAEFRWGQKTSSLKIFQMSKLLFQQHFRGYILISLLQFQ